MAKEKRNNLMAKLVEQQEKQDKLFRSATYGMGKPYATSITSYGGLLIAEEIIKTQEAIMSPIISIWKMIESFREPVASSLGIVSGIQSYVQSYQQTIEAINNSSLTAFLQSWQEALVPLRSISQLQEKIEIPNFELKLNLQPELWDNILDDDLQEATSILEKVKEDSQRPDIAIERLSDLVEKMLVESEAKSTNSLTKWQKFQVLMWAIALVFPIVISNYTANNTNDDGEKALYKLTQLVEIVSEKHKETTANLRLRTEPSTSDSKNILLVIPKGSIVMVDESISYWSKVIFTDKNGFVRSGWVSKKYLK